MTALFGYIGAGLEAERLRQAAACVLHVPWQQAGVWPIEDGFGFGSVWIDNRSDLVSVHRTASRTVALAGRLCADDGVLNAAQIESRLQRDGLTSIAGADGSYVLMVFDHEQRTLDLLSDPFATIPLCYGHSGESFAFGPEGKCVLGLLGQSCRISPDSARQFLLNRYLIGRRVMLDGVERLPPGHRLRYRLDDRRIELHRSWDLRYQHQIHRPVAAEAVLHDALHASHAQMIDEVRDGTGYQMFLTGGLDSRGILGYAQAQGRLPRLALTWGADESVPGSDAVLARRLAERTGTPFAFCRYGADGWCQHAGEWAQISELGSDNASSFATGVDWFSQWRTQEADFVVLGDEMFGAGAMPANTDQAIDNILRGARQTMAGPAREVLNEDAHQAAGDQFNAQIAALIDNGPNDQPKDIQDYLYFHTYIARWILAPGNFKAPLFNVRRPLMSRAVMDVVTTFAPALRVDKSVFVRLMARHFGHLMAVSKTAGDSNVQWRQALRSSDALASQVRKGITRLLEDGSPLRYDIDRDRLLAFVAAFFAAPAGMPASVGGGDRLRRFVYDLRGSFSRLPGMDSLLRSVQPLVKRMLGVTGQESVASRYQLLMRLALLGVLQDRIDRGGFEHSAASSQIERVRDLPWPREHRA